MKTAGIIPARFGSSRFPGKPLADIGGKPMIQRVYEQAQKSGILEKVIVATDDQRIMDCVKSFGGEAVLTSTSHSSGTSRCNEVADQLDSSFGLIINIQGDEPYIHPGQIEQVVSLFSNKEVNIATLRKKIFTTRELFDPNVVKVITDKYGRAICFSRQPIPYYRGKDESEWVKSTDFFKHIGIYGYRINILREIVMLPEAPPEKAESLEQMRWMWNGYSIMTGETTHESVAIDTPSDLSKITNKT